MAQNNDNNTFFLNSGLFPCVCVGMYGSPLGPDSFEESINNTLAGDPDEEFSFYEVSFSDWCKELTLQAGEYINDNIIEPLKNYGVLSIEATGIWSPKYYNYSNDQLEMTVTMSDDWRGIMAEKVAQWQSNDEVKKYIATNWRSYSGYVNFMPESLDEVLTENDHERQLAAFLTLAMVAEGINDKSEDGSRSLWALTDIMHENFNDYQHINVLEEYMDYDVDAHELKKFYDKDDEWNELYWALVEKKGFFWLTDETKRLDSIECPYCTFHADTAAKRLLFWAVKNNVTLSELQSMAA